MGTAVATRPQRMLPPGPRGHFLVGSLPDMRPSMLDFLAGLVRDHGDVVFFRVAHFKCCFINDAELIEQVLVRDCFDYLKSWDHRQLKHILGKGLLTSEGEFWRRQRRLAQPAFHHKRIERYVSAFQRHGEKMLARWDDGNTIDVHKEMMRVTLHIVTEALFSSQVEAEANIVGEAMEVVSRRWEQMVHGTLPIPLWLPTPGNIRLRRHLRRLDRIVYRFIREHRDRGGELDDVVSMLMTARDDAGRQMSDRQLRDEIITLFLAGHETTAIALSFCLYLIAQHPEVEEKLLAEYREQLGGRAPTPEDVPRLDYTKAVIDESMRLYPPAWGLGREATKHTELGDYWIPKKTQVFLSQYITHRNRRYFPDPERFDPDRWLGEFRKQLPRCAFFPFGAGPRTCIGAGFAVCEMTVLLPVMLQAYHFSIVPDHHVELMPAITLRPKYGIRMTVHRR